MHVRYRINLYKCLKVCIFSSLPAKKFGILNQRTNQQLLAVKLYLVGATRMSMIVQLVIFALYIIRFSLASYETSTIDIAYYELPPYIYNTKNGSVLGIFPENH